MDCSMPGFPVLHYLPEFAQTHVHWIDEAIQQSHNLSPPSPALNLSQYQGLFQWVGSLHQVAKVLVQLQLQHWSFQWVIRVDFLWDWLVWYSCFQRDSQECCPASILRCSAFFTVWLSHLHDYWNNHSFDYTDLCWQKVMSLLVNTLCLLFLLCY